MEILEENYNKFKEVFKLYSLGNNDYLTIYEFFEFLASLNINLSEKEISEIENKYENKDIILDDFIEMINPKVNNINENEFINAFIDINKSPEISISQFYKLMTNGEDKINEEDMNEVIRETDISNKKTVSYKDFI